MATIYEVRTQAAAAERDPAVVQRVAITATARLLDAWNVDQGAAATLAGTYPSTWRRMKRPSWAGKLTQDQLTRMSALVGLYQGLHVYFGEELADEWITLENDGPLFGGEAPLDFMLKGGIPAIIRVRDYVDAIRGGV